MEKVKQKTKEIFTDKKLYLFTIITFLFFGVYCIIQYAPDTYGVFTNSLKQTTSHFFSCGRIVTGLFFYGLAGVLKLNNNIIYTTSYLIAIICTIASLYKLDKIFQKDIKNNAICCIASILIIINIFSIELYVYVEKGILMLSILLCVLAVEQIKKFFEGNKKSILFAVIYMILANCCYQGTVGLFVAISLIYIIKYSKNIKDFIINNVIVSLAYGIPAIINFAIVRFIFTNTRVKGEILFIESLKKIYDGIKYMLFSSYDLLPKYLFAISVMLVFGLIIYKAIIKKGSRKIKILDVLYGLYIIAGTIFVTVAPQILQDTNSIWFVARSSYSVGALIGILLVYVTTRFEINKKQIIIILACLLLATQFVYFVRYTIDNYIVNYQDKQNVIQIQKQIEKYEKETGNIVKKVAFYTDKTPSYTYPDINATGDMNLKALYKNWSETSIIYYYTGKQLEEISQDENIALKFKENDWDYYDNTQVIFLEDTMHLCNF